MKKLRKIVLGSLLLVLIVSTQFVRADGPPYEMEDDPYHYVEITALG